MKKSVFIPLLIVCIVLSVVFTYAIAVALFFASLAK